MDLTAGQAEALIADAQNTVRPMAFRTRADGSRYALDLVDARGTVLWSGYAFGPTALLSILVGEQRFLVEDRGRGSVAGASYADKAEERIRLWVQSVAD